jgi:hypothetical protein
VLAACPVVDNLAARAALPVRRRTWLVTDLTAVAVGRAGVVVAIAMPDRAMARSCPTHSIHYVAVLQMHSSEGGSDLHAAQTACSAPAHPQHPLIYPRCENTTTHANYDAI